MEIKNLPESFKIIKSEKWMDNFQVEIKNRENIAFTKGGPSFPPSCIFTGSHSCCPTRNDNLGDEGGVPPIFFWLILIFVLLRKSCKNSES